MHRAEDAGVLSSRFWVIGYRYSTGTLKPVTKKLKTENNSLDN